MSTSKCSICDNEDKNKTHTVPEMMYGEGDKFDYIECGNCGCLQIAHIPENIEKYYPPNYYSYSSRIDVKASLKIWLQSVIIKNRLYGKHLFKSIASKYKGYSFIDFLAKNDYLGKNTKILDVGCGTGALLLKLNRLGFKHLSGVDPFLEKDIDYKNGVHIRKKYLHEIEERNDIVMLHHSFEHMEDPLSALNDIRKIL